MNAYNNSIAYQTMSMKPGLQWPIILIPELTRQRQVSSRSVSSIEGTLGKLGLHREILSLKNKKKTKQKPDQKTNNKTKQKNRSVNHNRENWSGLGI